MIKRMLGLVVLGVTASAGVSQADVFTLAPGVQYWGNPAAWISFESTGKLPGPDDAVIAATCCSSVYMTDLAGKPISATVRSFDGSGRHLYIDAGGVLQASNESQVRGLTLAGGQLTTFSTFTIGAMTVNDSGPVTPSVMTTPNAGKITLSGNSEVKGTLDFRGTQGEVQNNGTLTQSGTGNMSLWFGHDFRNRSAGIVDLQNDNGIAVKSPTPDVSGPVPIQFHNEAGATVGKSGGSGKSVIEAPIVNSGLVTASSGQLVLAGGGAHSSGAALVAGSGAELSLLGAHSLTGAVTASGDGNIYLGDGIQPGSVTIKTGGTLVNGSNMFLSNSLTVENGGKLEQGPSGRFYVSSDLNVTAGGKLQTSGLIQLESALVNSGEVTVKGGGGITGITGTGSYRQQAGTTVVEASGYFDLQGGVYRQDGGTTTVAAGGAMNLQSCDASTNTCTGGTYLQTAGGTKVNGSLFAQTVLFTAGELNGNGTIFGNVTFEPPAVDAFSGTISPANSPGRLTIDGNFSAANAIFNIEIGGWGDGDYDQLFVTGDATIDGGLVNFMFIDGFLPNVGDIFDWLVAQTLTFINAPTFAVSSSTGTVHGELIDGAFRVTVVDRPGSPGQVPEPGTLALLVLAGLGLVSASRRPRSIARQSPVAAAHAAWLTGDRPR